jgi:hypothetical protein
MKTRVYITVDVECREERKIGDKVQPFAGYDLRMWGRFSNQPKDLGIGLIMRELDRFGFKATFYVDPFGSVFFGADGLAEVCREIRGRGHDTQLHTHPIQRVADWITENRQAPSDRMADYSAAEQLALFKEGIDLLVDAGIPRDEIVSFRAGHFAANNDSWTAMAKAGIKIGSNLNPCFDRPGHCRIRWPGPASALFDTEQGVWELPVTNFEDGQGRHRLLQITAISLQEMKDLLLQSSQLGYPEVTIVTHSFEFFHIDSEAQKTGRPNTINLRRIRGLAEFLDAHRDKFEVEPVSALAARLPMPLTQLDRAMPKGKPSLRAARFFWQALKRIEAKAPQMERLSRKLIAP